MKKSKETMQQKIFEYYTTSVLEHEKEPTSVYRFCKDLKIDFSIEVMCYSLYVPTKIH